MRGDGVLLVDNHSCRQAEKFFARFFFAFIIHNTVTTPSPIKHIKNLF